MKLGLKKFVAILVLFVAGLFSFSAQAGEPFAIARAPDGDTMALYQEPCTDAAIIALVPEAHRKSMYRAEAVYKGVKHGACFTVLGDGSVGIADDEGDVFRIPMQAFADPKAKAPLPRGQAEI